MLTLICLSAHLSFPPTTVEMHQWLAQFSPNSLMSHVLHGLLLVRHVFSPIASSFPQFSVLHSGNETCDRAREDRACVSRRVLQSTTHCFSAGDQQNLLPIRTLWLFTFKLCLRAFSCRFIPALLLSDSQPPDDMQRILLNVHIVITCLSSFPPTFRFV